MSSGKQWDLRKASDCRDFLRCLRFGTERKRIEFLEQLDGREVSIDDATDDQVLQIAAQLAGAVEARMVPC